MLATTCGTLIERRSRDGSPLASRDSLVPFIGVDGRASSHRRSSADELGLVSEGLGKKDASDTRHKVPTEGPGQPV